MGAMAGCSYPGMFSQELLEIMIELWIKESIQVSLLFDI